MTAQSPDTSTRKPRTRPARSREESSKRWIAVLIAFVTVLISIMAFLQATVSARAAANYRRAQESALASTGTRTRGQQEVAFAEFGIAREVDELWANARRLNDGGESLGAQVYITASQEVMQLSPLLTPSYTTFGANGLRSSDVNRYEVDTWVVTATLLSEQRAAAAVEANAWDAKSNNYIAAIALFAATLFLLGLCLTLTGYMRWLFLLVGIGLAGFSLLWALATTFWPVHHVPDAAIQQFAQGYGLTWQGNYEQAVQSYTAVIKIDPSYGNAYYERGSAWLHVPSPQVDKAIQDLAVASNLTNENYSDFWNLGWAYYLNGDYAKSIDASQKALDLNSRVCGPSFNIAIARLALGDGKQAEKDYAVGIARCEKILQDSLAAGLGAPSSLWRDIEGSAQDIENLLCQTHQQHCYKDRERPDVKKVVNRDLVLSLGEKYLKRLKETLTALEYQHTATIKPTGAKFTPLVMSSKFYDENDQFGSYIDRERFPNNGANIYALWHYSDMNPKMNLVWKVYHDGEENAGLRYVGDWQLEAQGSAEKKINSWFMLDPGRYDVEVYGNGELLSTGTFEIDENETLTTTLPSNVSPTAPVSVGPLIFADDFANNNQGWWSGSNDEAGNPETEGKILNGEYSIITHAKDALWRVTCAACGTLDNFYYEVTTRYVRGPTDYWRYGIALRSDLGMRQGYLFSIDAGGAYKIAKVVDDKYTTLVEWTEHPSIRLKGTNRLGVLARGDSFEFFINGQSVQKLNDSSLSKGIIGLSVEEPDVEVAFSQVRVWQVR